MAQGSRARAQCSPGEYCDSSPDVHCVEEPTDPCSDVDPANIVAGRGQKSSRDFARFLGYALNSTSELEYHLIVARDIRAISQSDFKSLTDQTIEVRKMLHGLSNRVLSSVTPDASRPVPGAVKLSATSLKAES